MPDFCKLDLGDFRVCLGDCLHDSWHVGYGILTLKHTLFADVIFICIVEWLIEAMDGY